jgi:peptidoglycan/LPS O-acetylase OafA/YrhL
MSDHRIWSLELLRGLAAFSVAVPHFLVMNSIGAETAEIISVLGVEVFFILSGFVLAPQIIDCVRAKSWVRLRTFLMRRWMRTIPPYLFALLAISVMLEQVLTLDFARYALYLQNLFIQANTTDYYSVAWSLSVEEWFYVLFPAAMMIVLWRSRQPTITAIALAAIGFIVLITAGRLAFGPTTDWGEKVRRVVAFRIDSIAYGFVLQIVLSRFLPLDPRIVRYVVPALLVCTASAALAFHNTSIIAATARPLNEHAFPFLAALLGCSILTCFYVGAPLVDKSETLQTISRWLGRISYSVYLFHIIVAQLLLPFGMPFIVSFVLYLAITGAWCVPFYAYIERPILRARPSYAALLDARAVSRSQKDAR